jgi:hypothetical protein
MSTLSSLVFVPFKDISCLASCLGLVCLELVHSRICLSRICPLFLPKNCQGLEFTTKDVVGFIPRSEEVRAYNVVCALDDAGLKVWRLCARAPHHHAQGHLLLHDKNNY